MNAQNFNPHVSDTSYYGVYEGQVTRLIPRCKCGWEGPPIRIRSLFRKLLSFEDAIALCNVRFDGHLQDVKMSTDIAAYGIFHGTIAKEVGCYCISSCGGRYWLHEAGSDRKLGEGDSWAEAYLDTLKHLYRGDARG